MLMRILFVGKRHYTNQDALHQRFGRILHLPAAWRQAGYSVLVTLIDYYGRRMERLHGDNLVESVPGRSARAILHLFATAKRFRPNIVVASGDCFMGMLGHQLARRAGAKFVFDVYDDYRTFGAYRAFLGWDAFGFLGRRADLIMYASMAMAEEHTFVSPYFVVPNGIDPALFRPVPMAEARERLQLPQAGYLVGYFGSMTAEHGVNHLIAAVKKLRRQHIDIRLLLCGKQHPSTPVYTDGVLYQGMVPHHTIPDYLNACDVLALPYLNGAFLDKASSCKIAEYLYCRRPIVATRTPNFVQNFPDQARQLESVLIAPGNVDTLAESIRLQLNKPVIAEPPADMSWQRIAASVIPDFQQILG